MPYLERRELMAAVVSAAALVTLSASTARGQSPLDRDGLRKLVATERERTRLYLYMDLTIDALLSHIFEQNAEFQTYDDFSKAREDWRGSLDALRAWLDQFYKGGSSDTLLAALDGNSAEDLIAGAKSKAENLVGQVAKAFAEMGIAPEGKAGSNALTAISTVEQVNALQTASVPATPFLCGFFPFSWFCS